MLVAEFCVHEEALRADLQQYYGIDFDNAMSGAHTAHHIACIVSQLPQDARIRTMDGDIQWSLDSTLLASILNSVNGLIYGMSDKKKRGRPPAIVGPLWMRDNAGSHSLPARVMPADELMEILNMPREVC